MYQFRARLKSHSVIDFWHRNTYLADFVVAAMISGEVWTGQKATSGRAARQPATLSAQNCDCSAANSAHLAGLALVN